MSNVVLRGFPVRTNAFKFVFFVFIIDFQVTLIWWFGLVVWKSGKSEFYAIYTINYENCLRSVL